MKNSESSGSRAGLALLLICSFLAAVFGLLALLGWVLGLPRLASFGADLIPMAPSTAVLFLLLGAAIGLRARTPLSRRNFWISVAAGCFGALAALLLFVPSCLNIHWAVERLGMNITGTVGGAPKGHISPVAAFCFLLASVSFLASLSQSAIRRWRVVLASGSAGVLLATCSIFLLAYLYGTPLLYGGTFIPPALNTILSFTMLGLALLVLAVRSSGPRGGQHKDVYVASYVFLSIFVLLAAGIVTVGYFYYQNYEQHYRAQVERQLSAIAELKVSEMAQWRKERLGDANILFKNGAFSALVRRFLEKPEDADTQRQLRSWIDKYKEHYNYDQVRLLDAQGVARLSSPAVLPPMSSVVSQRVPEVLRSGQVTLQDFYRNEHDQRVYLTVMVPILDPSAASHPLGALVLRVDPEMYLYPFIKRWPTPSQTAETLLVRKEGNEAVFLNELRFQTNTALNLRMSLDRVMTPGVQAALGREGIFEGMDYRGVPVVSALHAIPDSPWSLVARMDAAEVYAPLRAQLWQIVVLIGVLIFGAGACVGMVWRQQRVRFYRERAKSAEALETEKTNLVAIFESSPVALFILDETTNIVRVNTAAVVLTAGSAVEALQHRPGNALRCVHASQDPRGCGYAPACPLCPARNGIEKLLASGGALHGAELPLELMRNGGPQQVWMEIGAGSVQLNGRRHLCVAMEDITARKQAAAINAARFRLIEFAAAHSLDELLEETLNEAEKLSGSVIGFYHFVEDDQVTLTLQNWSTRTKAEFCRAEGKGSHYAIDKAGVWVDCVHQRKPVIHNDYAGLPHRKGMPEGHAVVIRQLVVPVMQAGKVMAILGVGNKPGDYTPEDVEVISQLADLAWQIAVRKRAEEKLVRLNEHHELILGAAAEGIIGLDLQGNHTFVNPAAARLLGYTAEDLFSRPAHSTWHHTKADGSPYPREECNICATYRDGLVRHLSDEVFWCKDGTSFPVEYDSTPICERGRVVGAVVTFIDITARKRAEAAVQRSAMALKEKNDELERFLYTASHDLKSPVVTVRTFLGYLELDMASADAGRIEKDLRFIRAASDKMAQLLDELLEVSRVGRVVNPPVRVTLRKLVDEALGAVAGRIAERGVTVKASETDMLLCGDRPRLAEIWQNLVENACKFMGDQKEPRIEIGAETRGAETVFFVRDNGIGIDPRYQAKIFNLFEKLDPKADGTGLGLALVKRIVELYQGRIWMESLGEGQGACFYFTLPGAGAGEENRSQNSEVRIQKAEDRR